MLNKTSKKDDIELPLLQHEDKESYLPVRQKRVKSHFQNALSQEQNLSKYDKQLSFFNSVSFLDIWQVTKTSANSPDPLTKDQLPLPHPNMNLEESISTLDKLWHEEIIKNKPSLVNALYQCFKKEILACGLVLAVALYGRLGATMLLGGIINDITQLNLTKSIDSNEVLNNAMIFAGLQFFIMFFNVNFWYKSYIIAVKMRLAITGLIYKKLHSISLSSLQEINIGKVINLLANNLNDIDYGFLFVWPVILSPITCGLACYYIWSYFEEYSLISMIGLAIAVILSRYISNLTKGPRIEMNSITDERVSLTNELIETIRLSKMYAWEKAFKKIIEILRSKEITIMMKMLKIEILGRVFSESSVYFCLFAMCAIYSIYGGVLNPEKVYTSFMILGFVKLYSILFFQFGAIFIVNARVMQQRIEEILLIPDILSIEESTTSPVKPNKQDPIVFKNFTGYWNKNSQRACLDNINLRIEPGSVTAVIGKIGSGKTSLLFSFLREIPVTNGILTFPGTIAYVEQEPIIFSGSVRSNILFGREYKEDFYQKVIKDCNLVPDFRQFSDGDQTLIGERGVNLSGGQKARISLARAVYSQSDIYLLDDPLSAVDSKVARSLFENVIRGDLLKGKTVLLVTHHLNYAKESDYVVVMEEGKILAQGTFNQVEQLNINLLNIFNKEMKKEVEEKEEESPSYVRRGSSTRKASMVDEKGETVEEAQFEQEEEATTVTWETYKEYLKESNSYRLFYWICGLYTFNQITIIAFSRFLGYWAYENQKYHYELMVSKNSNMGPFDNSPYIFWGTVLTLILVAGKYMKVYLTMQFTLITHSNIHQKMLLSVVRAITLFFDKTPIGNILNRFSSDLGNSDKQNWSIFYDAIEGIAYLVLFIATLILISPIVAIPSLIVSYLLWKVKNFFSKPTMDSRKIDLASRSPLYSEISQTLNGLIIIRVFHQGARFIKNFIDIIYENTKALQFTQRTLRLFGLLVDLSLYILTITCLFLYIYVSFYTSMEPGLFGLAITMVLELLNISSNVIRQIVNMDINMQSAQRMMDYRQLPSEAPDTRLEKDETVLSTFNGKWPHRGEIIFKNVFMKYRQEYDFALNGLDVHIRAGTKVGCVGRTGAGKSSIIQVLFRMVEIEDQHDSYIKIDGVNIREIGLDLLRKNLSIIPQTAVIFTGSIRRNLDPFKEFPDDKLWEVLQEVNLKKYVETLPKRLDTDITLATSVFSAGQKQQICLARAILKRSKIIILDEATANVDIETDNLIQEKINEKFKDCTVLTIAHRLTTIAHYDKVIVMERGRVREYAAPFLLLVNEENDKRITSEGLFAKMVRDTGEAMSKKIFEIAQKTYFEKFQGNMK